MNQQLIVAGFHRSGTSMIARYLASCGLFLGKDLLGANESNPYGHYEDREFVRFHDDVLRRNGLDWMVHESFVPTFDPEHWQKARNMVARRQAGRAIWGVKDPRISLFLPFWQHLMPDLSVLLIFRNPRACAHSLAKRHSRQLFKGSGPPETHLQFFRVPDLALRMWCTYNEMLADFAERNPDRCVVMSQESFLGGLPLAQRLNQRFHLRLKTLPTTGMIDTEVMSSPPEITRVASGETVDRVLELWRRLLNLERTFVSKTESQSSAEPLGRRNFAVDSDLGALRMENELLSFENQFLKDQLARAQGEGDGRSASNAEALADIAELLRRLDATPLKLILHRHGGYRKLVKKYVGPSGKKP